MHFQNLIDGASTGYLGLVQPNTLLRVRFEETPHRRYGYGRVENVWRFAHGTGGGRVTHQLLASVDYRRDSEDLDTSFVIDHDVLSYVDGSTSSALLGGLLPLGQGLIYNYNAATDTTQSDTGIAAQDLIAIGTRLNILAGLRFESNRIDTVRTGTEQITGAFGGPVVSLDSAPPPAESTSVAPRLGVVFKATPRLSFYGSYLTAFNSPVPGLLTQDGDLLDAGALAPARGRRQGRAAAGSRLPDRVGLQERQGRCVRLLSGVRGERGARGGVGLRARADRLAHARVEPDRAATRSPTWSSPSRRPTCRARRGRACRGNSFSSWVQYAPGQRQPAGHAVRRRRQLHRRGVGELPEHRDARRLHLARCHGRLRAPAVARPGQRVEPDRRARLQPVRRLLLRRRP